MYKKVLFVVFLCLFRLGFGQSIALDSVLNHLSIIDSVVSSESYCHLTIEHFESGKLLGKESLSRLVSDASNKYLLQGEQEQLLYKSKLFIRFRSSSELFVKPSESDFTINSESFNYTRSMSAIFDSYSGLEAILASIEFEDGLFRMEVSMGASSTSVSRLVYFFDLAHRLKATVVVYQKGYAQSMGFTSLESRIGYEYNLGRTAIEKAYNEMKSGIRFVDGFLRLSAVYRGYEVINATGLEIKIDE